jgi:ribonuclease G
MTSRLLVSVRPWETQIALWSDDRLTEFRIEREGAESLIGNIYLGRVTQVERGLDAAFVDIGESRLGFLPLGELERAPTEGAVALVQVIREAREGKGAKLTARPLLPGRLLLFDPHGGRPQGSGLSFSARLQDKEERKRLTGLMAEIQSDGGGFVLRRAAAGAEAAALRAEAVGLRAIWRQVLEARAKARPPQPLHRDDPVIRMLRDHGADLQAVIVDSRRAAELLQQRCAATMPDLADRIIFEPQRDWVPEPDEIWEQVEAALEPAVPLPSGGSLLFESGATLTAVDVNSGRQVGDPYGQSGAERTLLRTNLEAAAEIARQLRLRNLGGVIIVDFIDLKSRDHRRQVVEALRRALSTDPAPCRVEAMSPLGLVEMTRRRRGPSLEELLSRPCAACAGSGRVRHRGPTGEAKEGEDD